MSTSGSSAARTAARYVRLPRRHGKLATWPADDQPQRDLADSRPDSQPDGHQGGRQHDWDPNSKPPEGSPNSKPPDRLPLGKQPDWHADDQRTALGPRVPARRSRRMSLRARMLVMLVGVTTVLLLIMGAVSTYLMARRVDGQLAAIDSRLRHLATYLEPNPLDATKFSGTGYAVVEIPLGTSLGVRAFTHGSLTDQLSADVASRLTDPGLNEIKNLAAQDQLTRARILLLSRGCGRFPAIGCKPFDIGQNIEVASQWVPYKAGPDGPVIQGGRAVLLVAQRVGNVRDQVPGFIIAELITGTALIVLLAVGGEWLIGRGLEPLDEMTRTANEITTRGDLTARMPDANDQTEVGRLGSSINTMLDRIQQAFSSRLRSEQKVREFAADASHELRTPLTTIRGYAELYRQGALGPDQLPNAMRRIEQEAERMSTLVAELLELARLDRKSSLDLTETDLAGVVRDAVADASAVEPQRPVRSEAPPRLVAVVDEPRIRQVLANLLGNVRAHTPVHTPVAVRLGAITGGVLIEVADAGPGMSTDDAIRAFDRFHRAVDAGAAWESQDHNQDGNVAAGASPPRTASADDETDQDTASALNGWLGGSARMERTSGAGLGLSIVQAIANAHGGRATLESYPGQGTKVRVWLPVRIVP